MGLIACPDCGKQISDAAPTCIGCGRPMRQGTRSARVDLAGLAAPGGPACPKCGGELVPFARVHDELAARGTPTNDALAQRVAPPTRAHMQAPEGCGWVFMGALLTAGVTWFFVGFVWAIAAFVVSSFVLARAAHARRAPEVEERLQAALARRETKHLCARCGATVVRTDSGLVVEDLDAEIDQLVLAGQKIQAIKLVRERMGLGLKEAKDLVDSREGEVGRR